MSRRQLNRLTAALALAAAIVAVVALATSGSTYVLHAQFSNAGQLVGGDLVTVAGHQVGSIGSIRLTDHGLADVELDISDQGITPLRQGTLATIGQLSLTGVANRFVGLSPGAGPPIPSGGTLPPSQTRGIVDLDAFLDSLTPPVRASIQRFFGASAFLVAQPTASQLNELLRYLNPSLSQNAVLGSEIVSDKFALDRLISSTAEVSSALAARSSDLGSAVSSTAATLREIASERAALQDSLVRAPAVLGRGTGVLADVNHTLGVLTPALSDLQPVAPRLARLLEVLTPTERSAAATIAGVQALVPAAETALGSLPQVERSALPAVSSLTRALSQSTPLLAGFRPYAPDVIAGFFNGSGGAAGGGYDANGHYLKSLLAVQGTPASYATLVATLGKLSGSLGPFNGARTGLLAPCPGGGGPPAADRSNPWIAPDVEPRTGVICDPAHDQK